MNSARSRWLAAVAGSAVAAGGAHAQVLFSISDAGPSGLGPRFVYERTPSGPVLVGGGPGMRLMSPMDQLDDFGGVVPPGPEISSLQFIICFSVDRMSNGTPAPPFRVLPPFNVFDQAQKRQQAGDVYGSTEAYGRSAGRLPTASMGLFNNMLLRNQSAEYFGDKDFGLLPVADPAVFLPPGTPIDDVDGHAMRGPGGGLPRTYFTISTGSPSLSLLGGTSGADIFYDTNITLAGGESLFASFDQLGLFRLDDIDGLAVYDDNGDGHFNGTDQVFFSLKRGSPTLFQIGASAADILTSRAGIGVVQVFEVAENLGLLPSDDIDSLKLDPLLFNSAERTLEYKLRWPPQNEPLGAAKLAPRDGPH